MMDPIFAIRNAFPATLRKPVERSSLVQGLMARAHGASQIEQKAEAKAALPIPPGAFCRMPDEPEDARLTGVTRSLPRRLLALNLPGSLRVRNFTPVKAA